MRFTLTYIINLMFTLYLLTCDSFFYYFVGLIYCIVFRHQSNNHWWLVHSWVWGMHRTTILNSTVDQPCPGIMHVDADFNAMRMNGVHHFDQWQKWCHRVMIVYHSILHSNCDLWINVTDFYISTLPTISCKQSYFSLQLVQYLNMYKTVLFPW